MICRDIEDVPRIIRALAENGEPDPAFKWDVQDM
jgi:hypothetical protein